MRNFYKAKFICFIAGCGQTVPFEQINHHEMYEFLHWNIQYPALYCQFINKLETVIFHSIKCPFHLIYCAECNTLSNVSVFKQDCKVIQAQHIIPSYIKYYDENPPHNYSHKDVLLGIHSLNESFEDYYKHRYDLFMFVLHGLPSCIPLLSRGILQRQNEVRCNSAWQTILSPTPLLPRRILQRQNKVKDL